MYPRQAGHRAAKKNAHLGGVWVRDAVTWDDREPLVGRLPPVEIWGIGPRLAKRPGDLDDGGPPRRRRGDAAQPLFDRYDAEP